MIEMPRDEPAGPGDEPPGPLDEAAPALTLPYRVRFDETTPAGTVRTSALLRYAQDAAWAHSERLGFGRDWYAARGLSWLVRAVELRLHGTLGTGAIAGVTTSVIGFRRVLARRRTTIVGPDGVLVASIDTDWAMVDQRGALTRVPDEFPAVFGAGAGPFVAHRVGPAVVPAGAVRLGFATRLQELDPMAHANNATYLDWLEEAVEVAAPRLLSTVPRTCRLEYLLPATPGDALEATAWLTGPTALAYRLAVAGDGPELLRATLDG